MNQFRNSLFFILIAFIFLLNLSGCGGDEESVSSHHHDSEYEQRDKNTMQDHASHMTSEAENHSTGHHSASGEMEQPTDARKVSVVATDFRFNPATIVASPGEKLYIELVNRGNAVHMWQLEGKPETHVHTAVGETAANVITAPQEIGSYKIVCGTPGHVEKGMVGTLYVE